MLPAESFAGHFSAAPAADNFLSLGPLSPGCVVGHVECVLEDAGAVPGMTVDVAFALGFSKGELGPAFDAGYISMGGNEGELFRDKQAIAVRVRLAQPERITVPIGRLITGGAQHFIVGFRPDLAGRLDLAVMLWGGRAEGVDRGGPLGRPSAVPVG